MPKDLGDIIIGSIFRHAVLGVLTGGVGNVIAGAFDLMDVMDACDVIDASQATSSGGQIHFGMDSSDPGYNGASTYVDDHGNLRNVNC